MTPCRRKRGKPSFHLSNSFSKIDPLLGANLRIFIGNNKRRRYIDIQNCSAAMYQ